MSVNWQGVLPAITTPFTAELEIDGARLREHCQRMLAAGCVGVIPCGSLGESATLSNDEKVVVVTHCAEAVNGPTSRRRSNELPAP